jgi:hypothetical protein
VCLSRYQELFMDKEALNRKWDEENQILIEAHAEYLRQITEEYDRKVGWCLWSVCLYGGWGDWGVRTLELKEIDCE